VQLTVTASLAWQFSMPMVPCAHESNVASEPAQLTSSSKKVSLVPVVLPNELAALKPSWRHTTVASTWSNPSSHTWPHWLFANTSTRPELDVPPTSRTVVVTWVLLQVTETASLAEQSSTPTVAWAHESRLASLPEQLTSSSKKVSLVPGTVMKLVAPEKPSWRQTTFAALRVKRSSQTWPHWPLAKTSTRPVLELLPTKRTFAAPWQEEEVEHTGPGHRYVLLGHDAEQVPAAEQLAAPLMGAGHSCELRHCTHWWVLGEHRLVGAVQLLSLLQATH
jgi:hypothetical protein